MRNLLITLIALISFVSCEKTQNENQTLPETLKLDKTEVTLYSQDEHKITSNGRNCTYSTQDPFIASVNDSGNITALHIGETFIEVKAEQGSDKVKVTVLPKYNVIKDPYIKWGCAKDDIKAKLGSPAQENSANIVYTETLPAHAITGYTFKSGKLSSVTIALNPNYQSDAQKHLAERYQYWTTENGAYVFTDSMTNEWNTYVILEKVDGIWCIIYTPKQ